MLHISDICFLKWLPVTSFSLSFIIALSFLSPGLLLPKTYVCPLEFPKSRNLSIISDFSPTTLSAILFEPASLFSRGAAHSPIPQGQQATVALLLTMTPQNDSCKHFCPSKAHALWHFLVIHQDCSGVPKSNPDPESCRIKSDWFSNSLFSPLGPADHRISVRRILAVYLPIIQSRNPL